MSNLHAGRVIGTETEYGVYRPGTGAGQAVALSTEAVRAYAPFARASLAASPVEWDYRAEDPLNDLRGRRLDRAAADPSQLTDDPYHLAPPGGSETVAAPTAEELRYMRPTSIVLPNGGRLYVDHAHPEYSAPEAADPLQATLWDRAGEVIAQRIMSQAAPGEPESLAAGNSGQAEVSAAQPAPAQPLVLVKNNVDGKGATYGAHENYLVSRMTDLDDLIRLMIPFLVTRPIYCGAGRLGIGQVSEEPGFQISQRADYVENDIGLETTFNRPIFNTRDEPHADAHVWRRVHVIGGDANLFDVSTFLRLGTTSLVLWAIEQGTGMEWDTLALADPVLAAHQVSRDLSLSQPLPLESGADSTALDLQLRYLELVREAFARSAEQPTEVQQLVLDRWAQVLEKLASNPASLAAQVEWIGKYQLLSRQRQRFGCGWDDARLAALDLQWADLRPEKSIVAALSRGGLVERLFTDEEVARAADEPPVGTRATARGHAVTTRADLRQASWTSLVYATDTAGAYRRVPLAEPTGGVGGLE